MTANGTDDEPYRWTESDDGPFALGAVIALVHGCSPGEALDILGPDRAFGVTSAADAREWAHRQELPRYGTALEAGTVGGWTLVVELNGYRATLPDYLEALSTAGEAVVIYRSVDADSLFQYAKHGVIVREFDPLRANFAPDVGAPLPEEAGIDFPGSDGELHPMPGAFRLAERITGVRLTEAEIADPANRIAVGIHPR